MHGPRLRRPSRRRRGPPPFLSSPGVSGEAFDLLRRFEEQPVAALRPDPAALARVPAAELVLFAGTLVELRAERLRAAEGAGAREAAGRAAQALNTAAVALRGLAVNTAAPPIGMLNLERIEMAPVGIQRGELVSTIPLAPGEVTAVTHKEWSVTSKEFTTIVEAANQRGDKAVSNPGRASSSCLWAATARSSPTGAPSASGSPRSRGTCTGVAASTCTTHTRGTATAASRSG
ncbi:hypothetical protein [Nonomuraea sp. NPDC049758]|uniref:hypothetical protein n=1 Tax=Nonomuraea sp. NPDC049758 TaxID=3154360 RepID=UPI00341EAAB7